MDGFHATLRAQGRRSCYPRYARVIEEDLGDGLTLCRDRTAFPHNTYRVYHDGIHIGKVIEAGYSDRPWKIDGDTYDRAFKRKTLAARALFATVYLVTK